MKLKDVMLRAMVKRITWYQAAEIVGISCRQMQRWQTRFKHEGYEGLFDRRRRLPSPKRVPLAGRDGAPALSRAVLSRNAKRFLFSHSFFVPNVSGDCAAAQQHTESEKGRMV